MLADDSVLSLAIFKALARCVSLSPDSESASALIQEAYAEPENPVSPSRDTDVIYYYLSRDASSADLQQAHLPAVSYSGVPPGGLSTDSGATGTRPVSIQSFQAFLLNIIAYGPHSRSNAHQIRSRLFIDGAKQPRALLRAAGIYPIPTPPEPELLWEQHGSLWRRRSDLTISLRVCDTLEATQQAVKGIPEIYIRR